MECYKFGGYKIYYFDRFDQAPQNLNVIQCRNGHYQASTATKFLFCHRCWKEARSKVIEKEDSSEALKGPEVVFTKEEPKELEVVLTKELNYEAFGISLSELLKKPEE